MMNIKNIVKKVKRADEKYKKAADLQNSFNEDNKTIIDFFEKIGKELSTPLIKLGDIELCLGEEKFILSFDFKQGRFLANIRQEGYALDIVKHRLYENTSDKGRKHINEFANMIRADSINIKKTAEEIRHKDENFKIAEERQKIFNEETTTIILFFRKLEKQLNTPLIKLGDIKIKIDGEDFSMNFETECEALNVIIRREGYTLNIMCRKTYEKTTETGRKYIHELAKAIKEYEKAGK